MSLLQQLPYAYYSQWSKFGSDWCVRLARAAKISNSERFRNNGLMHLLNELDTRGYTLERLFQLVNEASAVENPSPTIKIALLIGNTNYECWEELVTPETDCRQLENILKSIGFITVTLLNMSTDETKRSIMELFRLMPKNSYCFVYYAGHGIEFCGTKYILGVESPSDDYTTENGVSENFIIKHVISSQPLLTVILFDMCRKTPDRLSNPKIYSEVPASEEYECEGNLVVGYSTSPFMPTFEKLYCQSEGQSQSQHLSCNCGSGATSSGRRKNMSLYVEFLSKYLQKDMHITRILEMVQKDFSENNFGELRLQKPQKLDNLHSTYYLNTKSRGDPEAERAIMEYLTKFKSIT